MSNNQSGLIDIAELTYIDPSKNSNKFYRVSIVKTSSGVFFVECVWGRIGSTGSRKEKGFHHLMDARGEFNSIIRQKAQKGYKVENLTLEEWNLRERQKETRRHIKERLLKL